MKRFTLSRQKRIKRKKDIENLFSMGKSFYSYPLQVVYLKTNAIRYTQVAFSVPKRNFKLAVIRNRIKRRMKEAYRLNQNDLAQQKYQVIFIYKSKKEEKIFLITHAIKKILLKLN